TMSGNSIKSFQTLIFETVVMIVSKINSALYYGDHNAIRSGILSTFIQFQAVFPQPEIRFTPNNSYVRYMHGTNSEPQSPGGTFHEELLQQWLNASEAVRDKLFENAYFFCDILFKSLCVHLTLNGGFLLPPRKRHAKPFLVSLE